MFDKERMLIDVCIFGVFAFTKSIKMKLSDKTAEFFQFKVVNQYFALELFSIYYLYPCSLSIPFD